MNAIRCSISYIKGLWRKKLSLCTNSYQNPVLPLESHTFEIWFIIYVLLCKFKDFYCQKKDHVDQTHLVFIKSTINS